ncbi:type II toxin-antitoxin system RelE/ParE family toxin [Subsaximicrobium wynnwilliamsii]|uniref:Type II toxin-antitoxin system RelE/ParE family toxin n=1 Tax=Subsaximicrobium wynnwilliamsii TaxID=291179 RepID=A0A5C6ZCT2_9FLAO|nr:type II toxin-antitoxin system RelE/ParE family toxin [Subsaximicrobium wynnwilliamsii]TXD86935.1 type II toxin-antitoxin system RelE/ParE family toxin [Subsaximicrobium wynnwilliamsii]TXE00564.1 type II toxin-antitoxin system RelE/ParE family toxin [Subsaximicrobium wynnwilliamsii]
MAHIAKKSPQNALHVLKTLTALADSLANMPYKYPMEPIYGSEQIRFVSKWAFKIIYRVETERIFILRVFSTNQDPSSFFE